jgi:hypothetical protein
VGFAVPALLGLPVEEAILSAERAGLSVTEIRRERRPEVPEDRVLSQTPGAGFRMTPGGRLMLVVNRRPTDRPESAMGAASRSGFIRHRLAPGFLRQHVRLHLVGAGMAMDLFDEYVAPGTELWFMVPVTGNSVATLYVDEEPVTTRIH